MQICTMKNIQCPPKVVVQNAGSNRGVNPPNSPRCGSGVDPFYSLVRLWEAFRGKIWESICADFLNCCKFLYDDHIMWVSPEKDDVSLTFFSSFFFGRHEPFELRKHSMTMSPVKLFRFLNVALPAAKGVSDRSKEPRAKRNQFQAFFGSPQIQNVLLGA